MTARILVVDDDPECLQFMKYALERGDFIVSPATSVDTAVRWLREPGYRPDLVILDVALSTRGTEGLALCESIKNDAATRHIPVVIMTGFPDNARQVEAMLAHANLFLRKPVEPARLREAADALLTAAKPTATV